MAVSQSLYLTQESQSTVDNASKVRILWKSTQTNNSHNLNQRTAYYYVSINGGAEVEYSVSYNLLLGTTQTILDVVIDVPHDSEGRGSVSVRTWMDTRISAGVIQLSKSLGLTQIARSSTIGATDANIGATSSIIVTRQSKEYSHSIQFRFGSLSGYISADGSIVATAVKFTETSISFTVPVSFYGQIPDDTSGTCTLICRTYSGSTQIGSSRTCTFTVTAGKSTCAPVVVGTVLDSNPVTSALTGDSSKLVRYASNALCTISATAKNGASIVSKSISGVAVVEDTHTIEAVESGSVTFAATDSRGYLTVTTVEKTLIEYIKLTANIQLTRDDPTSGNATLVISGEYFNGSFGAEDNSLTIQYRVAQASGAYGDYQSIDVPAIQDNEYSIAIALSGLDYEYAYSVQIVVADRLSVVDKVATVSQGIPLFDWGEKDFRFNVPIRIPESCFGDVLPLVGKKGQMFFQKNSGGDGFLIRIHDGTSWQ